MLLSALPKSYDHLRDAILYGKTTTITFWGLELVLCALKAKELHKSRSNGEEAKEEQGFKWQDSKKVFPLWQCERV